MLLRTLFSADMVTHCKCKVYSRGIGVVDRSTLLTARRAGTSGTMGHGTIGGFNMRTAAKVHGTQQHARGTCHSSPRSSAVDLELYPEHERPIFSLCFSPAHMLDMVDGYHPSQRLMDVMQVMQVMLKLIVKITRISV
jgi:hypothetical protein